MVASEAHDNHDATLNTNKAYPFRRCMAAGPDESKDQHEPFELVHRGVHWCRWCHGLVVSGWWRGEEKVERVVLFVCWRAFVVSEKASSARRRDIMVVRKDGVCVCGVCVRR